MIETSARTAASISKVIFRIGSEAFIEDMRVESIDGTAEAEVI
jgi:hypothetical protein